VYENGKIRPDETLLSRRRGGIKESDGGYKFN
jgi:hypothetical protein